MTTLSSRSPRRAVILAVIFVAFAAVVAGTASGAKPTITISWSQTHYYDSGMDGGGIYEMNESNVSDACGGTGRIPLSGPWIWESTMVLEPFDNNGMPNYHFIRGRVSVTYALRGVTNGGVTYTGTGKVSTNDLPPSGGFISLASDDKLKGSDGSVLKVHQSWGGQYGGSVFQGYLDPGGMQSYVDGATCVKAAH